jgi:hypothetical protein
VIELPGAQMSRFLLDSIVALTQLLGAGTGAGTVLVRRQPQCFGTNLGLRSFRPLQPGPVHLTNERGYVSASWVRRWNLAFGLFTVTIAHPARGRSSCPAIHPLSLPTHHPYAR